jgi:hypothetical protein
LAGLKQSVDRGVEVPMFLAQALDMAQDRLALFVAQFVLLRHGPAPCTTPPRDVGALHSTMRVTATARKDLPQREFLRQILIVFGSI